MPDFNPKYPAVWKAITKALRSNGGSSATTVAIECYSEIESFIDSTKKHSCRCEEDFIHAAESM